MKSYQEYTSALGPLETFVPSAFEPDANVPESLCGFMVALALIHNDLKDLLLAGLLISGNGPAETSETRESGQAGGILVHTARLLAGLTSELLGLVTRSPEAVAHRVFKQTLQRSVKQSRDAWAAIEAAAFDKPSTNPMKNTLVLVRNKIAFHYDAAEILKGYSSVFGSRERRPLISRGNNLPGTRFYFADAAAQGYCNNRAAQPGGTAAFDFDSPIIRDINRALHELVINFVQVRGVAWRSASP